MTVSMEIDQQQGGAIAPTEASYIESLEEPWKSIALQAVPPTTSTEPLLSAASRLFQLEVDVRSQILSVLQEAGCTFETAGTHWKAALELCTHLVHYAINPKSKDDPRFADMVARKLPFVLLEDCLDGLSVQDSQEFWTNFVEPALTEKVLLGNLFWTSSPVCHLPFLRVCNQFLKVLETASTGKDQEWKGRILWALSKGFSITDRSALKVWGSFHNSNSNDFETQVEFEKDKTVSSASLDYTLYKAFWSLQADFSNPNRIQVAAFIKKITRVLEELESSASNKQRTSSTATPAASSLRYMTSSALLPTQLTTPEFRSSVLSQFLIVASHLSSESPPLANALSSLLARARKLLKADHPQLHSILWDSILSNRETHWRQWKKQKCPVSAFAPKQQAENGATAEAGDEKSKKARLLDGPLGVNNGKEQEQVYELLDKGDLIKISQELQKSMPTLEQHLETYVEALDPESGIEEEYHPKNNSLFAWRAMRLYAKHQLPLLKQCRQPADLERMTRQLYQSKGKEIPGEMPPAPEDDSSENDESSSVASSSSSSSRSNEKEAVEDPAAENVDMKDDADINEEEDAEKQSDEDDESIPEGKAHEDEKDASMEEQDEDGSVNSRFDKDTLTKEEDEAASEKKEVVKDETDDKRVSERKSRGNETEEESPAGEECNPENDEVHENPPASPKKRVGEAQGGSRTEMPSNPPSAGDSEEDEGEVEPMDKPKEIELAKSRKRSRSADRDPDELRAHPPRDRLHRDDHGRGRSRQGPRGGRGGRHDDGPPPRGSRHEEDPASRGGRRDDVPPPRGGRRDDGPPLPRGGRRDDGPPARGGRHDDGPPPRGGRHEEGPSSRGARHEDDSAPRGGRGGERFGGGRDERHRGGGGGRGDRRGGRDDGRWRGRRR